MSPKKQIITNLDNIEIKLIDLILFYIKLNNIYLSLNNNNYGPKKECTEFIDFYFYSSLKNIFPFFFNDMNKIVIKSAINLLLVAIIITYHLSLNPTLLNKLIYELKNIYGISKNIFYLFIRKIQLFYGERYILQNEIYFKNFNDKLLENGFTNLNENQIVKKLNRNCYEIVNNINKILNFYKSINNYYYLDFFKLFSSISKITEIKIHNYFYNRLYNNSLKEMIKLKKFPLKEYKNEINNKNDNINKNKKIIKRMESKEKEKDIEITTILKYHKNKISPPFLKKSSEKKYTLVLNLEETLININKDGVCKLRPGLYPFLNAIKPY